MAGTLYTYPGNHRAFKILVAAQYSGANVNVVSEPPNFVLGETNKTAEFIKKFPTGKVPAFETSNGDYIFESNAIAHYVGNDTLKGKTAVEQSHVVQWINYADNEILPAACTWVFPSRSLIHPNKPAIEQAKEDVARALTVLNDHLLTRTFLVGERITQADISVLCTLLQLYEHVLEPSVRNLYPNLSRWLDTLVNQPQLKAVIGDVKLCETAVQFDPKKFAEIQAKLGKDKKSAASCDKKEKSPKKPEKKQEKPSKKEEEVEEMDETEAILASEPKSKDPFEVYPKGTFNMDDFKRVYSNEEVTLSLPYFWEKFDKENYSIWYGEYKYSEDLTQVFMSCNLIAGMFQRLDKMRKNAFGSSILFGTDNKSTISGVWIWRGHDLAFTLCSDWQVDYESYVWKKLDPDVDDTKKLVNEYLSWAGDFSGKTFNQGKIFK